MQLFGYESVGRDATTVAARAWLRYWRRRVASRARQVT